jgi:hypothetical protein
MKSAIIKKIGHVYVKSVVRTFLGIDLIKEEITIRQSVLENSKILYYKKFLKLDLKKNRYK